MAGSLLFSPSNRVLNILMNDRPEQEPDVAKEKNASDPTLAEALNRHELSIPPAQIQRLEDYCQLLWAANQRLNLTRHLDYETFVIRDVIDSLALAEQLSPDLSVLDVGTGVGYRGFRSLFCDPISKFRFAIHLERSVKRSLKSFSSLPSRCPFIKTVSKMLCRSQSLMRLWRGRSDHFGKS